MVNNVDSELLERNRRHAAFGMSRPAAATKPFCAALTAAALKRDNAGNDL